MIAHERAEVQQGRAWARRGEEALNACELRLIPQDANRLDEIFAAMSDGQVRCPGPRPCAGTGVGSAGFDGGGVLALRCAPDADLITDLAELRAAALDEQASGTLARLEALFESGASDVPVPALSGQFDDAEP